MNKSVIKFAKEYGFDKTDVEDVTQNLDYWEKRFEREAGIPYDESTYQR